jgi:predicted DsbA family dithiol-disulfide isomerase
MDADRHAMDAAEAGDMVPALQIELFFDFVCPWCLIGKRNVSAAVGRLAELRPDVHTKVVWRSHQLLPDTPLRGVSYEKFYLGRLGSAEAVAARRAQVKLAGRAAGIEFAFERIAVLPNTAAAHKLVGYAADHGTEAQQAALIERLFTAYFTEGEDIGDFTVLERVALESGLKRDGPLEHLADSQGRCTDLTRRPQRDYGITGVPFYVFNRSHAVSGAYSPDALLQVMLRSVRG